MNKKQTNKKLVRQNKRNRLINRRYSSAIKALSKLLKKKVKAIFNEKNIEAKEMLKNEAQKLESKFYSVVDKAIKKNVIHKNNGARKKSNFSQILITI
jgi:small subunit ribosomal protein S20